MGAKYLNLEKNVKGKDYIVGDLHGCYFELQQLLHHVNFNHIEGDRLFSVGDLIDRGPDSNSCIQLIDLPYFYGIQGNHENMMVNSIFSTDQYVKQLWFSNGGDWSEHTPDELLNQFSEKINTLPLIITVGAEDRSTRFNIVHSEIIPNYITNQTLDDNIIDAWEFSDQQIEHLLWGRLTFNKLLRTQDQQQRTELISLQQNLSLTYCGHTIIPKPLRIGSHLNIDTGGYLAHRQLADDPIIRDKQLKLRLTCSLSLACHQDQIIYSYNQPTNTFSQLPYDDMIVNQYNQ